MRYHFFLVAAVLCSFCSAETLVYFGTYTRGKSTSEGVYVSRLDESTGALSKPILAAPLENPSFVAIHPNGKTLYAVSEVFEPGKPAGGLAAFSIQDDGTLTQLNERASGGGAACHVAVDPTGRCVGVANYGGGSCALFPIEADGSLGDTGSFHQHVGGSGVVARRQSAPHAHSINFNADGTQAFVADLGLDQILLYDVDPEMGTMKPSSQPFLAMPPGGGPRHFCFAPEGDLAFSNLEITSRVAMLDYDKQSKGLSIIGVLDTIPETGSDRNNSTAECLVHPNGKFVYVSNRGHNSIAVFRYESKDKPFVWVENESTQGAIPRGFGIDPSGTFLIVGNQNSGNVVSLRIDAESGSLSPTGHSIKLDSAVNVRFLVR